MNLYLIIAIAVVVGALVGFLIGRLIFFVKPIGLLILNETDHTKEFFEFHFTDDIDIFRDKDRVSFHLAKR